MNAYYNENDPKAAAWLRELIKADLIVRGDVDERSIEDVTPDDLGGYVQRHFFAGIGGWSYALRLAGWPDDKPVWTGSCPCQPFSAAGKRKGTADERHLWPAWHWLIKQCRPDVIFGEQVASKDGITWLETVSTDLEGEGYTVGPIVFPACGVGAPEIRARTWFVAESSSERLERRTIKKVFESGEVERSKRLCDADSMEHAASISRAISNESRKKIIKARRASSPERLGDAELSGSWWDARAIPGAKTEGAHIRVINGRLPDIIKSTGATRGAWTSADWLYCRDGKLRSIEPGTFPLVNGLPGRVGLLRGYGNAIVPQVAAEVIGAYMDFLKGRP